mgnify:FL=1
MPIPDWVKQWLDKLDDEEIVEIKPQNSPVDAPPTPLDASEE